METQPTLPDDPSRTEHCTFLPTDLLSLPGRAGDIGLRDPFAMPYQTIESVLPLSRGRLMVVNDTNFGSHGRNPSLPDYSDVVLLHVPALDAAG